MSIVGTASAAAEAVCLPVGLLHATTAAPAASAGPLVLPPPPIIIWGASERGLGDLTPLR